MQRLNDWNVLNYLNDRNPPKGLSPPRQRPRSHELLEDFNDLGLPWNISHRLFMRFRQQRRRFVAGKLFVFLKKRWILISLAKAFL